MKLKKEMMNVKEKVQSLLTKHPHLRDDDNKLIANIWYGQLSDKDISAGLFLQRLADGKMISCETIRRTRQVLQAKIPELRGELYKSKKDIGEETKANWFNPEVV